MYQIVVLQGGDDVVLADAGQLTNITEVGMQKKSTHTEEKKPSFAGTQIYQRHCALHSSATTGHSRIRKRPHREGVLFSDLLDATSRRACWVATLYHVHKDF